jgi:hypothetical protein
MMWQKDGKGNWFMAGQSPIAGDPACQGSWQKNQNGDWQLVSQSGS